MALTYSSEDLINKAASILGKYVPGEALGPIEHDTIDGCIDRVLDETAKIVVIGDRDAIPGLLFETIARLVAIYAAAAFSNSPPPLAVINEHEQRLRYLIAQTPTYETLQTLYF